MQNYSGRYLTVAIYGLNNRTSYTYIQYLEELKSPFPAMGEVATATLADSIASGAACTVPTHIHTFIHTFRNEIVLG